MNDLIPCACCHISDKIGRNEKTGAVSLLFFSLFFTFIRRVEFA
jgi:uncharacterized membrane protein